MPRDMSHRGRFRGVKAGVRYRLRPRLSEAARVPVQTVTNHDECGLPRCYIGRAAIPRL